MSRGAGFLPSTVATRSTGFWCEFEPRCWSIAQVAVSQPVSSSSCLSRHRCSMVRFLKPDLLQWILAKANVRKIIVGDFPKTSWWGNSPERQEMQREVSVLLFTFVRHFSSWSVEARWSCFFSGALQQGIWDQKFPNPSWRSTTSNWCFSGRPPQPLPLMGS